MGSLRNSNTDSSETTENSKSVVEIGETGTGNQLFVAPDTSLAENSSNNICLKTLELDEANNAERKDADLRNISDC